MNGTVAVVVVDRKAMEVVAMDCSTKIRRDESVVMALREEEKVVVVVVVAVVVDVNESKQPYRREFEVTRMGRRALEIMMGGLPTITKPLIDGTAAMNDATNSIIPRFSMVEIIVVVSRCHCQSITLVRYVVW